MSAEVVGRIALTQPRNRIAFADARLCADCDGLFDGRAYRGMCPCGSGHSVSLESLLSRPRRIAGEGRGTT